MASTAHQIYQGTARVVATVCRCGTRAGVAVVTAVIAMLGAPKGQSLHFLTILMNRHERGGTGDGLGPRI